MRPKLSRIAIALLGLGLILSALVVGPKKGRAITIGGGGAITLEGEPLCAGPPTTNNYLQFSGSQWCDASSPVSYITAYISTLAGATTSTIYLSWAPPNSIHIRTIEAQQGLASAGCSTQAVIGVNIGGVYFADTELTLSTAGHHANLSLNDAISANATPALQVQTADSGCGTHAQGINVDIGFTSP